VDLEAPIASLMAPVLRTEDDTGVVGDNATSNTTLTFSSADSGQKDPSATIALVHDVNGNGIFDPDVDVVLATESNAGPDWTLEASLANGSHRLGLIQYDAAGNVSVMSPTAEITIGSDDFAAGGFSATSATAPDASFAVGMTSGINE